jgi:hypothetical protein
LRAEIARGRSCASILVVPQRKMVLVRALYGRRPWPELELTWEAPWGSSPERGGRGKERGTDRWVPWGGGGRARPGLLCLPVRDCLLYVREESRKEEGEEKRERKEKKGRKKSEKISNLEISKKIKDNL